MENDYRTEYVDGKRKNPYKNYKFLIKFDGTVVAGVSKVSPLKRTTEVITHCMGGENSRDFKSPGRTTYEGITCEHGITSDTDFEDWANKVSHPDGDPSMALDSFRKDLLLEVLDEKGQVARRYKLFGCWVSEFTAVPDLDASGNAVAIESIKIEMDYWTRESI
ncbi:MAG: T4-like virus tail tube protein gp19 [Methanosaeta sp. PtaU1.Bin112]|nr:MAG: T4-like virus tail tube protein gp19 [Methanosaeta sp. PtaU1.Bin112]